MDNTSISVKTDDSLRVDALPDFVDEFDS